MSSGVMVAVDVDYREDEAVAAAILFRSWTDASSCGQHVARVAGVAPYVPGELYRRELPALLAVLAKVPDVLSCVVVDGFVWLDEQGRKGLGAHLHDALGGAVPVVGVAKSGFRGSRHAVPVLRGGSRRPLWITAVGIPVDAAADGVARMHGNHRIPTLLQATDALCRRA
ncbi:MAG: endonuclease V [Myxococcota bacterium]